MAADPNAIPPEIKSAMDSLTKDVVGNDCVIFGATTCPYCTRALKLADSLGARCKKIDFDTEGEPGQLRGGVLSKLTGMRTIPQVFVNKRFVGGYGEMLMVVDQCKAKSVDHELKELCQTLNVKPGQA